MESQTEEWKESWDKESLKTVCAFANTDGGVIIIGKKDNGKVIGVQNSHNLMKIIPDTIKNKLGIMPSLASIDKDGRTYITITVKRANRLVDLDGMYYKRVGSTTHRVTGEELRRWILADARMSWTDLHVEDVDMSDLSQEAIDFFVKTGIESKRMSPEAAKKDNMLLLKRYKLMDDGGLHNSAAILFLENPRLTYTPAVVKIGAFSEDGRFLRHDKIDCSVVMQPDRTMNVLLDKYIQGTDEVKRAIMVRVYPYPERALREAVINSIVHRDYSSDIETYISVYPDHLKIFNPGFLPAGWTKESLFKKHESKPTNPKIANVFYEMGLIEQWGSGIEMMRKECEAMGLPEPEYDVVREGIEVTFRLPLKIPAKNTNERTRALDDLTPTELKVYNAIVEGSAITRNEMAKSIGVSLAAVKRAIVKLTEMGLIERRGGNRNGKWIPK